MEPVHIPGVANVSLMCVVLRRNLSYLIVLRTGPFILGFMWSYCLYGMLVIQVYIYAERFAHDRAALKILVWSFFFLETVFTVFMTIAAWNTFGPYWGVTEAILFLNWSWIPLPPLSSFMAGMAQTFYAWRIYCLTRSLWLPVLIELVMLMQVTANFVLSAIYFSVDSKRRVLDLVSYSDVVTVWLAGSAACDLIITVSLVVILYRRKPDSAGPHAAFRSTAALINKLIRFNMETGMITSICAIIELALFLSTHQYNMHLMVFLLLGKMYSNILMATLNYRESTRQTHNPDIVMQSAFWADAETNFHRSAMPFRSQRPLDVRCPTETNDIALQEFSTADDEEPSRPQSCREKYHNKSSEAPAT
ncbi:hypothetical protein CPB85DRAFT_975128 [Mucidula mucida]|nr:hypothetical protein CPB85DRAFT_975128 [Mucidula mucida]